MSATGQVLTAGDTIAHLRPLNSVILLGYAVHRVFDSHCDRDDAFRQGWHDTRSMNIFPVFTFEQVNEDQQEGQIQQHISTNTLMPKLDGVG